MNIEIQDAVKKYDNKLVLDGFSLKFPLSGTVCLFGPSGCGKTTLLNCIAGLNRLDSGVITGVKGQKISYVFQEDRLLPWSTAAENVAEVISGKRKNAMPEALKWLKLVGLQDEAGLRPSSLSGGMCRRVAIARALAHDGGIFLFDEPFQKLDEANKIKIMELISEKIPRKLKLLVTHDAWEAEQLADITYVLSGPPVRIVDTIRRK